MLLGPQHQTQNLHPNASQRLVIPGEHTNFNSINLNVEQFITYRPLSSFTRWLAIICIPTSHKDYQKVLDLFNGLTHSIESGVKCEYDLSKDLTEYEKKTVISKYKWYTIDLRSQKDDNLKNSINLKFPESTPEWMINLYFNNLYNKMKGLVIFADNINQIPKNMHARSNFGLCDLTETQLTEFLNLATYKRLDNIIPINKDNKIVGYVNGTNWIKLVEL